MVRWTIVNATARLKIHRVVDINIPNLHMQYSGLSSKKMATENSVEV